MKRKKIVTCIVLGIIIILSIIDLREILIQVGPVVTLYKNLIFLSKMINKLLLIVIFFAIAIGVLWGIHNVSIKIPKISVAGIDVTFNEVEKIVRLNVKNYLSTKRSLFKCHEKYDNYYDVINSYYDIYQFLRKQMACFDYSNISSPCFSKMEEYTLYINEFLTKYQSDYRRWYNKQIEKEEFVSFYEIQSSYEKYEDMRSDFVFLNVRMIELADYFDINTSKWNSIFNVEEQEETRNE